MEVVFVLHALIIIMEKIVKVRVIVTMESVVMVSREQENVLVRKDLVE